MRYSRILNAANMYFNAIRENTICAKHSQFTVSKFKWLRETYSKLFFPGKAFIMSNFMR